ncbi:MAG: Mrp/NBP35 family ATP-binding protein [Proteobacteria bacterium]|nr:Mrp/NBP35 family ATP-binding protein [Pseudomonadota bacterium]
MSPVSEQAVLDALRPIEDPDFKRSIVDLGFVKNVRIDDGAVAFAIELTTPACPVKDRFRELANEAVSALEGVSSVEVEMTAQTRGSSHASRPEGLAEVRNVLAVASGKGGVGKSTVASNLAVCLAESGAKVGLLDCDVYGPSVPLMMNVSEQPRMTADKKIFPLRAYGLKLMSIGFLTGDDAPVIWRGPMVHGLMRQFLSDVQWGELDYLVLDMPPGTGDAALTVTQSAPLAGALIVSTPQEMALIDARKGLKMFQRVNVPVLGLVENMSWFEAPDTGTRYSIFGSGKTERTAEALGVPILCRLPIQPDVVDACDSGKPIALAAPESAVARAFGELAGSVARKIALLNSEAPPVLGTNIEWVNTP